MTILFGLTAEFGSNVIALHRFAELAKAKDQALVPELHQDRTGAWWCDVMNPDLVAEDDGTLAEFKELREKLFEMLRVEQEFRFAAVGVEVFRFRTHQDLLKEDIKNRHSIIFNDGVVLSDSIWSALGRPSAYNQFSPTHLWIPCRPDLRWHD